jgi:hypothetical protein
MNSRHASVRAQQRGIPPFIIELLDRYGQSQYDGHGAVIQYFNKQSLRDMERDLGRKPVSRLAEWHDTYEVVSSRDGCTITVGHRHQRVWRK